ncbi:hypothetical protein ACV16N_05805 [Escherichia coli]|uniref:hypothetical protein n=1 Tax=Enterobacteriaceae TaxID=543 RepID=UPI001FF54E58|nr:MULTISPECIES: hypothetical protein [Enterobacteriaceae]MDZ9875737.1 hypothetical protein [Escherichia coli]MEA0183817.1 hypothetical protein [Escherichia coli]MED8569412.1 hypothetical protein [Escherichia coli]MED8587686.1 hypothetical protein [Escherichia coli]MED8601512.1 hypothetical protein [Escherichia coli]
MVDSAKRKSSGHIKKRISDAEFLIENQRYEAALLLLLIAIDGSAIKVFPKGTQSISHPTKKRNGKWVKNEMSNSERYQRFLGVRLMQELGVALPDSTFYAQNLPQLTDWAERPETIIYKAFRNNDVHESKIPEEYHYVYSEDGVSDQFGISFASGEIKFNKGFLTMLKNVVVRAECNRSEFSSKFIVLTHKDGLSIEDYIAKLSDEHGITKGRIAILVRLMNYLDEEAYTLSNGDLRLLLNSLIEEHLNGSNLTGLCSATAIIDKPPLCTREDWMTNDGVEFIRTIKSELNLTEG